MGRASGTTVFLAVLLALLVLALVMLHVARHATPTSGLRTDEIRDLVANLQTWFALETRPAGSGQTPALRWLLGLGVLGIVGGTAWGIHLVRRARSASQADASKRS